ncbi:MAG: DUF4249 family protein [Bacteroidales bacterium]|nr:DUF4249 family protein [Bacteroidales bacterium]
MIYRIFIPLIFLIIISGCKEIYDPDIETNETAIVIQGLLTNIPGELAVRISQAVPYDSSGNTGFISTAKVFIVDNNGEVRSFVI